MIAPVNVTKARAKYHSGKMKGEGIKDIWKKIKNTLGPLAAQLGPVVLKEIIIPMAKKKLAGQGSGNGLKLAGQGRRKVRK